MTLKLKISDSRFRTEFVKGIGYNINYPVLANFRLFLFHTQDEAVAMCLETCVKISNKSDKKMKKL